MSGNVVILLLPPCISLPIVSSSGFVYARGKLFWVSASVFSARPCGFIEHFGAIYHLFAMAACVV